MVTKSYKPSYLCDSSDSFDSCDSFDSSDISNSYDSCDRSDQKTLFTKTMQKKTVIFKNLFTKKKS